MEEQMTDIWVALWPLAFVPSILIELYFELKAGKTKVTE